MCKLVLLGGVPGVGKTTIAYELARIYKIDKVLSIDILKNVIKNFVTKEEEPYLYTTTHEAHIIDNVSIVDGYIKHSNIINKYVLDILNSFKEEKIIIIEGATINQSIVSHLKEYDLYYFNLYLEDKVDLIKRYENKLRIRKGKWIENLDKILEINEYLKNQKVININTKDTEQTLLEIRRYLDEDFCN